MSAKLKLNDVAYFSSEHPKNSVKNLLAGTGKWTTPSNSKLDILEAEFCLPTPSKITGIDVGNYWSASLEVLVGLSEWPQSRREVLLPEHIFMNRIDCSVGENKQKMMFFREEKFSKEVISKKWDRVKVVCKQQFKFNNDVFGLGMFVIHGGGGDGAEVDARKATGVNKSVMGSNFKSGPKPGLAEFMIKAKHLASTPKASHVPSVLKNLENQKRIVETDSGVSFSSSFNASAMSRTAKLVVQGQNQTGKQPTGFEVEAGQFLKDCQFEKKTFAEIEGITFRIVKELWLQKKKYELKKDEKDILKNLSSQYLSKLVSRSQKRPRDEGTENFPPKKRKVSDQVQNMRKKVDIVDVIEDNNSSMRNRIATMDMEKPKNDEVEEDDPDILALRKKFNQSKPTSNSNKIIKTPNPSQSKKLVTPQQTKGKTPKTMDGWLSKAKSPVQSEKPTFDLDFSLEMSPKASPPKPKQKISSKPATAIPNYNRKHLLSVPHPTLISSGILVQVYNYKKDKKLPLKGNTELSVKKGEPVTFFKVGPDIHLESKGRFYLPDIQPEHMERVFKNFSSKEVIKSTFPDNLDKLLKMGGSSNNLESSKPDSEKKVVKSGVFDDIPSPHKPTKQSKASSTSPPSNQGQCPICSTTLPLSQLADHAAACEVLLSDTEMEEGAGGSKGLVPCPICQLEVEKAILEQHATTCAASMFGV